MKALMSNILFQKMNYPPSNFILTVASDGAYIVAGFALNLIWVV